MVLKQKRENRESGGWLKIDQKKTPLSNLTFSGPFFGFFNIFGGILRFLNKKFDFYRKKKLKKWGVPPAA